MANPDSEGEVCQGLHVSRVRYTDLPQVFAALNRDIDPKVLEEREKAVQERVQAQYAKAQQRLQDLVSP